jgi:hypothetical protein
LNINDRWYGELTLLLTDADYVFVSKGMRGEEEQVAGEGRLKRNCIISIVH